MRISKHKIRSEHIKLQQKFKKVGLTPKYSRYYYKTGKPIKRLLEWGNLLRTEYKFIAISHINGYRVSTIWLGLDHGFSFEPTTKPIIFETMIFGKSGALDYQERCSTKFEARMMHNEAIRWVKRQDFDARIVGDEG